jgi:hypothetical protein
MLQVLSATTKELAKINMQNHTSETVQDFNEKFANGKKLVRPSPKTPAPANILEYRGII